MSERARETIAAVCARLPRVSRGYEQEADDIIAALAAAGWRLVRDGPADDARDGS